MFVPTRLFWILLLAGMPLALLDLLHPQGILVLVAYDVILFTTMIVTGLIARREYPVQIDRTLDKAMSVRVTNTVRLRIENAGDRPLKMRLRDELPFGCTVEHDANERLIRLEPWQYKVVSYDITPSNRGTIEFPGTFLRIRAPLGLVEVERRVPTDQTGHVYPNIKAVSEYELLKQKGHLSLVGMRRSRFKGLGSEFESLRDYNDDDFRRIDWKASARRGKLVVKNYEQETNQSVIVCVDVGRHMLGEVDGVTKLDYCLDASLLLMHAAERAGDQVGLLIFNDEIKRYIVPRKGRQQVMSLLEAVHDVRAEAVQPNYLSAFTYLANRWKRRSLIVVFTDAEDIDQANALVSGLAQVDRRHLVMVVRVADPSIKTLAKVRAVDDETLFQRTAAVWYQTDRLRARSKLAARGTQSVEAEPQELNAALVGAYLRVKELNLI